MCT
ncbi:hypothetical protein CP8484711_0918A, partial [Chlamydia psittaci 84-8471/1]|jgi:hypothetical protein